VYLRGWVGYFRIQEFRNLFRDLDGWIRSRLRSMQLKKWKNPRKFQCVKRYGLLWTSNGLEGREWSFYMILQRSNNLLN